MVQGWRRAGLMSYGGDYGSSASEMANPEIDPCSGMDLRLSGLRRERCYWLAWQCRYNEAGWCTPHQKNIWRWEYTLTFHTFNPIFSFIILYYLQWAPEQSHRYGDDICSLSFCLDRVWPLLPAVCAQFAGWLLEWNWSVLPSFSVLIRMPQILKSRNRQYVLFLAVFAFFLMPWKMKAWSIT